jgi:hypothetical protein
MQETVVVAASFVLVGIAGCSGGNLPTTPLTSAPQAYAYANRVDNGGKIYAVPGGGSITTPIVLAAAGTDETVGDAFAFDGATAYYDDEVYSSDGATGPVASLFSVPVTGGAPTMLVTGLSEVYALAVDSLNVYFVVSTGTPNVAVPYFIAKSPLAGGTYEMLVPTPPAQPIRLATASGFLYWTDAGGNVNRIATAGGDVEPVATNQNRPMSIVADPSGVYWTNEGQLADSETAVDCGSIGGSVAALRTNVTAPVTLAGGLDNLESIAVFAGIVYVTVDGTIDCTSYALTNGQVLRIVPGSTEVQALASGLEQPDNVFADGGTVYYTTNPDYDTATSVYHLVPHAVAVP